MFPATIWQSKQACFLPVSTLLIRWWVFLPALLLCSGSSQFCAAAINPLTPVTTQAAAPSLPTAEQLQAELAALAEEAELAEEIKVPLTDVLKRSLEAVTKLAEVRGRRKKLEEQVAAVPRELAIAKAELAAEPPPPPQVAESTPLDRVRSIRAEREAELAAAKSLLAELSAKSENRKTRRVQATELVASLRTDIQKAEAEALPVAGEGKSDTRLVDAMRQEREARLELLRQRLALQQQEQRTIEAEEELVPQQISVAQRRVAWLEKEVALLTQAVSNRREIKVEQVIRKHHEALLAADRQPSESVIMEQSKAWIDVVRKHGEIEREKTAEATREEQLRKELADTQQAIENDLKNNGTLRSGLGMKLLRQRERLPDEQQLRAAIRSADLRIEDMGAFQAQLEVTIDELAGGVTGARFSGPQRSPLVQQELALLAEIDRDVENYTTELIELKNHLESISERAAEFRSLIDSKVLWIRNSRPYLASDLELTWHSFQAIVTPVNLRGLWDAIVFEMWRRPDIVLLWLLALGCLLGFGSKLRRAIAEIGEQAVKRNQAAMRPTIRVMWMTALLALPLVVMFWIPGWRLVNYSGDSNYVRAVGSALELLALAVFPLELARQILRPHGLAIKHFGLCAIQAQVVRTSLRTTIDAGAPLLLLWGVAYHSGIGSIISSLARPLYFIGALLIAHMLWRVLHPERGIMAGLVEKSAGGWVDRLRYVWHYSAVALPIGLGLLCLAGYSYSAIQLAVQLYWTLWLVLGLTVTGGTLRRWVTLSRRRLLLAQARQRASEAERREGVPIDLAVESTSLDLSEINAQTLRLINTLMTVMTVVGLYYMWAAVLPAVQFLDSFELWPSEVGSDGTVLQYVTLGGLLKSLPVILLTFVSVRNVPGLLENVLLQKLPLENAARYAITTLSSYVMLMVGIVLSAQTLGLHWESIQWLVAALGVGLGFGLQEIFANFISGIILLFEQPIRVGDVVTIDGTTGAVSKIRMRATTVVNWDRQELIIPNKDLITGRVINWTLSDSTNRIVLNVGVAYGSDTRAACRLLEAICDEHPNVAEDPAPIISFEGFGDSTLNLVVRCYLKTLDVRLTTIHELNTEVNERFLRDGIELAFPQRDLHIRSLPAGFTALSRDSQESKAA